MHWFPAAADLAVIWAAVGCAYMAGKLRHRHPRRAGLFVVAAWLLSLLGVAL